MKHSMVSKSPPSYSQLMSVLVTSGLILVPFKGSCWDSLQIISVKQEHELPEAAAPTGDLMSIRTV